MVDPVPIGIAPRPEPRWFRFFVRVPGGGGFHHAGAFCGAAPDGTLHIGGHDGVLLAMYAHGAWVSVEPKPTTKTDAKRNPGGTWSEG